MKTTGYIYIAIIGGIAGVAFSIYLTWSQHHKITTFRPVEATVVGTRIQKHRGVGKYSRGTSYEPVVQYRFVVEGRSYTSESVSTGEFRGPREFAERFVGQYPVGKVVEAYYNPKNPSDALLFNEYTFSPYGMILISTMLLAVFVGIFSVTKLRAPGDLIPAGPGWYEIKPKITAKANIWIAVVVSLLWFSIGIAALGHYFRVAETPYRTSSVICMTIYGVLGLVPVAIMIRCSLPLLHLGKTRVFVDQDKVTLGEELNVQVEQQIRSNSVIKELKIGLVCEKAVYKGDSRRHTCKTVKCHDDWVSALQNHQARAGETITAKAKLLIPAEGRRSNPEGSYSYPYRGWRIEEVTKLGRGRGYKTKFPIFVDAGQEGS